MAAASLYRSSRDGVWNLYLNVASGTGQDERLMQSSTNEGPASWSVDGGFIVYEDVDPKTRTDLWVLPLFGDRKPFPFLRTEFSEAQGQLSPDGRGRAGMYAAKSQSWGFLDQRMRPHVSAVGATTP